MDMGSEGIRFLESLIEEILKKLLDFIFLLDTGKLNMGYMASRLYLAYENYCCCWKCYCFIAAGFKSTESCLRRILPLQHLVTSSLEWPYYAKKWIFTALLLTLFSVRPFDARNVLPVGSFLLGNSYSIHNCWDFHILWGVFFLAAATVFIIAGIFTSIVYIQ